MRDKKRLTTVFFKGDKMRKISSLTSNPNQSVTIVTSKGVYYKLNLRYLPTQFNWVMDIVSDNFELYNQTVHCTANILDKFHNLLDFGLAIWTIDGLDPMGIDNFESGYAQVYILDSSELNITTEYLDGILTAEV